MALLEVEGLSVGFGAVRAVDGLDLAVERGEIAAVVGESGCGKSVTALAILRLVPPPGRIEGGTVRWEGEDLLGLDGADARQKRVQVGR